MRISLTFGCLLTAIFIIYRTWGEGNFNFPYQKADGNKRKLNSNNNVNEQVVIPRATVPLRKENVYESEVLAGQMKSYDDDKTQRSDQRNLQNGLQRNDIPVWNNNHQGNSENRMDSNNRQKLPITFEQKLVHIDLKGAPPLISYYKQIFPLFRKLGVTGLLIEYEDMFPYWGSLRDLSATNAYTIEDIKLLIRTANKFQLQVMPLVQTFGHMEYVLKQSTFMSLREVPTYPQVICPSQNESMTLIYMMIDQIMALHPHTKWIHIGCDEVYYLGNCNFCQQKMMVKNWAKEQLFLNHAKDIAEYVKEKHGIQPIMWDDMFRQMPEDMIRSSGIWKHAEIMAWRYDRDILSELPPDVWNKYGRLFSSVWIASAFKGATGPAQYITHISHHLENHISWLQTLEDYGQHLKLRGIAITGWQRYDHFAVLCELLPASLPSLAVNLLYLEMRSVNSKLLDRASQILDCSQSLILDIDPTYTMRCNFPGSRIFEGVQHLYTVQQELTNLQNNNHMTGWLNQYNIDMHFSSPALVETALQKLQEVKSSLSMVRDDLGREFPNVYDKYVMDEWFHLNIRPLETKIDTWLAAAQRLMSQEIWPRRPLVFNKTNTKPVKYRDETL